MVDSGNSRIQKFAEIPLETDTIAPDTQVSFSPSSVSNRDIAVTLNVIDVNGAGGKHVTYEASGTQQIAPITVAGDSTQFTISADVEGETTITYFAMDRVGNTEVPPKSKTVTIDKGSPTVQTISPSDEANQLSRGTKLTAQFSEDVDGATVKVGTYILGKVQLSSSQLSAATKIASGTSVSYEPATRMATLDPYGSSETRLARCQWYTAKVTRGVKDVAGNPAIERMWTFRTRGC